MFGTTKHPTSLIDEQNRASERHYKGTFSYLYYSYPISAIVTKLFHKASPDLYHPPNSIVTLYHCQPKRFQEDRG